MERVTRCWMETFITRFNIVNLAQRGRLTFSPEKELYIEKLIASYIGILHREFTSGEFDENLTKNIDETFHYKLQEWSHIGIERK